ncbi:VOC family protein [Thalassobacillus hwangdonensis]|uniref:VOC family protein n=1 Tax=Thalassobacillus hwangdonensis TaxID=546108 RepID=A0ABW3L867_9BACI
MAGITGLGGVFLNIDSDVKKLVDWYRDVLELDVSEYGINFLNPNTFTLITFANKEGGHTKLNFTVDDLDAFMEKLVQKQVKVIQEVQEYDYGKFARIEDVSGNMVELWEPFEDNYREMVEKEMETYNSNKK